MQKMHLLPWACACAQGSSRRVGSKAVSVGQGTSPSGTARRGSDEVHGQRARAKERESARGVR
jgi:hypothetical protein